MPSYPATTVVDDDDTWLIGVRVGLAKRDLAVVRDRSARGALGAFLVHGPTLQLEGALTAAGGEWDQVSEAWRLASPRQLLSLAIHLQEDAPCEFPRFDPKPGSLSESLGTSGINSAKEANRFLVNERIRRLAKLPPEALEPDEIIEIMVAMGTSITESRQLAVQLMSRFGSLGAVLAADNDRYKECLQSGDDPLAHSHVPSEPDQRYQEMAFLFKTTWELLQRILKEKIKDRPVIGSWAALIEYLQVAMQHVMVEHFRILFLDRKNILVRDEVQSRGTVDHTPLYPREVVKRALELAASAIIMVHNHPSGDPTPSGADVEMTKQVVAALGQVGITVHDHIIVGKNRHTSFRTLKLL